MSKSMLLTSEGLWRCLQCKHETRTVSICAGAFEDGHPRCGTAVCARCAAHCPRCTTLLCSTCFAAAKEGDLCLRCLPPSGGRAAYYARKRAEKTSTPSGYSVHWGQDEQRARRSTQEAEQSVDDAMRRADEIERSINAMKIRLRKPPK